MPNVASSSNATLVIVAFVVDLEQDPKFPKATTKKWKYEFGCKFQDVWVIWLPWAKSMVMVMGRSPLLGAKFVLKLRAKKSLWSPNWIFCWNMQRKAKLLLLCWGWKLKSFMGIRNVSMQKMKFNMPKSLIIKFNI